MAHWGGRFSQQLINGLNNSMIHCGLTIDSTQQDIFWSVAWSKALVTVGVLSQAEQSQLEQALMNCLRK